MTSALDSDNSAVLKWGPKTRGKGKKGSLSAATSCELLEPVQSDDSTAIPVRKSRRLTSNHKVEKILSQVDTYKEEDGEAAYFCQVQGIKRQVKLKESDLKHAPDLLRSFKSKKSESLASGEDNTSNFSRSKSLAKPASVPDAISSDLDAPNLRRRSKRQKKHYWRSSLSSTSDQTQLNPKNVRRSTRSSQSQPKYNFRTHISSEEEDEEDELEESGSDRSKQKKNQKNQIYVMSEESDESEYKSWRSRNQKSKVRAGSLLDHFRSLEEVYAQGCWLECSDCSSSYHFGCLPADMKKDIAAQHKAERLLIMEQLGKDSKNKPGRIIDPSEIPPERKEPLLVLLPRNLWRDWSCVNCNELSNIELENILAWRRPTIKKTSPTAPPSAPEQSIVGSLHDSPRGRDNNKIKSDIKLPSWKQPFEEAEYLCKYVDFGYSDCSWLTHSYLAARYPQRLQSFLTNGPLVDLKQLSKGHQQDDSDSDEDSVDIGDQLPFNLNPDENADQKIPKAWLTPERILSIKFDDEEMIEDLDENDIPKTPELMYEKMGCAFIKWQEQSYAAENYMKFRKFAVPFVKSERELEKLDACRQESQFRALEKQPRFIPNELMNFQLEGLNFCY
ncbi:hypothetical protein PPACK8108_LOCUS7584 [Phakopsora pachyrhizi]|uniref:Zinc finger PHD-type domain-containing protein n=1 Tax=Phakopsora pachyrhizi TaxID=170000 RepID=A0AAV0AUY6_PHAPC|nr:hypothetical protein PPACK8108_LOCUS7584 [Phakopsora pachyrhizi]